MAYEREDGTWESLTAQFCFLAISQHSSQALTCPFSLVRLRAGVSLQEGPLHSIHPWRMPCDCADPQPSLSLPGLGHTSPPGLFSWLETETVLKPSSQQSDSSALLFSHTSPLPTALLCWAPTKFSVSDRAPPWLISPLLCHPSPFSHFSPSYVSSH